MPASPAQTLNRSSPPGAIVRSSPGRWILNSWMDLLLFVSTPLLILPFVFLLRSSWVGVDLETISLAVALGSMGHHLPGMIRAYGDPELFGRFRMRFLLAPILLLAVCMAMSFYRLNGMLLLVVAWGAWHALMQVYGFVRIYDVKAGSVSAVTGKLDWLMCVTWFAAGMVFSDGKTARLLNRWYDSGGPLIPPSFFPMARAICLVAAVAVLIAFLINHAIWMRREPKPNPIKLLMLASGIGFWWIAMVFVDNIVLGVALFEIFHDVQYLAIVWLYNCRRVNTNPDIGAFMKLLFRRGRGMLPLYVGMVCAYGALGMVAVRSSSETVKMTLTGLFWASAILHFYYDGFIWKVRESSTRAGLGLNEGRDVSRASTFAPGEMIHALKWVPLVLLIGWLTIAELSGSTLPPVGNEPRRWPNSILLERARNVATAAPGDLQSQKRAAITLANLYRTDEAIVILKGVLARHPSYADGHQLLAAIYHDRGDLEQASDCYRQVIVHSRRTEVVAAAHHRLGEVYLAQQKPTEAEFEFREALRIDPQFGPSIKALQNLRKGDKSAPRSREATPS